MGKTWYFIEKSRKQTKRKLSCYSKDSKEKPKAKTTGLPPVKRFLYSHIARLSYLIFRMGKNHVDTCTSVPPPSSLESAPCTSCVGTET